jgi:hypothetical protein
MSTNVGDRMPVNARVARLSYGLVLAAASAMLAVGCSQPSASGTTTGAAANASAAASDPDDCLSITVPAEGKSASLFQQAESSDLIVVGSFKGYGPDKWNTPDAKRPPQSKPSDLTSAVIMRPIKARVDQTIVGKETQMAHALSLGGKLGCDSYTYERTPELDIGQTYVYFLWPMGDSTGRLRGDLGLGAAYPVNGDDEVVLPDGTTITLSDLTQQIETGTLPTPLPQAVPAEPDPSSMGG